MIAVKEYPILPEGSAAGVAHQYDSVTRRHVSITAILMRVFLEELGRRRVYRETVESWNTSLVAMAALWHDIGKITLPKAILEKPGALNEEEYRVVKLHAELGGRIVNGLPLFMGQSELRRHAADIAIFHHERWNGNGYPSGLYEWHIPLAARIMALLDVYEALTSKRPYRKALHHNQAVEFIMANGGTQFDPYLVDVFLSVSPTFPRIKQAFALNPTK